MGDDDRELVERVRRGDGESFGVLYDRTRDWLYSCVIVPRVGRADADDVLAETFRIALARIREFEWRGVGLLHWLAAIARRKCQERARGQVRELRHSGDLEALLELPDDAPSAEAEMIRVETLRHVRERVGRTLESLNQRYADVLRLRLLEGRGRRECAEAMAVSTATFDVLLYRATRAFARAWGSS